MTDTPENPDTPPEDDLQSLIGGIDFTPDWAKEEPGVKKTSTSRDHGSGGGHSGPRAPRKSSRGDLKGVRVKPRRDSGGGGGGGGNRNWDNRSSRPRDPRPPRVPVHVDFIPEKKRLSKVVNVIRQTRRVFPLKVVASKFMENAAFLSVKYTVKKKGDGDPDFELHVCRANGMVFSDKAACEAYILEHGIDAYYESEVKEVEPPSGNFPGIGRHTKTNRLIGPPNWHGYQARMDEVRQEVDPSCPPDIFARQVEMVRDDEIVDAWKMEVSQQIFYRPKLEDVKESKPEKPSDEPSQEEKAPEESPEPAVLEASGDDTPKTEETGETADDQTVAADAQTETVDDDKPSEKAAPEVESEEEASDVSDVAEQKEEEAVEEPQDDRPYELTREQVEAEFRVKVLPKLMKTAQRAIMPGVLVDKMTDPSLLSSTQYHLKRETDRPNSIIFALRPAFKHMRLKVYRYDGQLMVSSVEPHPLPEDLKVTPEIRQIIDYVANHPLCHAKEALEGVAKESSEVTPDLVSHFRWLIEKGHLIEFYDEKLLVPESKAPKS